MDPLIVDATPKGSAILAYGTARGLSWNAKLLAIIAGSFALIALIAFGAWFFLATITLPERRLITIALQPRAIATRIDPVIVHHLPPSWRAVIESRSRFPALLGVSLDEEGRFHAFAVMIRTSVVASEPGLVVDARGLVRVLHDGARIPREAVPLHQAFSSVRRLHDHDGAFAMRADLFAHLGSQDVLDATTTFSPTDLLTGTWDGSVVHLDISSESMDADMVSASLFAVLGDERDAVAPVVYGLLRQGVDLRGVSNMPTTLALDPLNEGTLYLYWHEPLSPQDRSALSAVRGFKERRLLDLPDSTTHPEFHIPKEETPSAGPVSLYLGSLVASSTLLQPPKIRNDGCEGTTRFLVQDQMFQSILLHWGIPESVSKSVQGVRITDSNKGVSLCFY